MENKKYETFTHSQRAYLISKTLKGTNNLLFIILFLFISIAFLSLLFELVQLAAVEIMTFSPIIILLYLRLRSLNKELGTWTNEYMTNSYTLIFNTIIPEGNNTAEKIYNLAKRVFPELNESYSKFYKMDKIGHLAIGLFFIKIFGKKTVRIVTDKINKSLVGKKKQEKEEKEYHIDLAIKTLEGYFIVKDFKEKILTIDELHNIVKIIAIKINKQKISKYMKFIDSKIFRLIFVAKHYDQPFLERESLEKIMTEDIQVNFKVDLIMEEEKDKVGYTILWIGN